MAASTLTLRDWKESEENGKAVWTCTITTTTADLDLYTKKTPVGLNVRKPWEIFINTASATLDGTVAAIPVDLYIGWDSTFALTENNAPVVTGGVLYKADIYNDVRTAVGYIQFNPNMIVAEDVSGVAAQTYIPVAPYYIFNLDCASAMNAVNCTFKIIQ